MCLPSDAFLQHLGFSHLGRGISLHGCSSKAQSLLLTLDEGYLLTSAFPDLQRGIAPLGPIIILTNFKCLLSSSVLRASSWMPPRPNDGITLNTSFFGSRSRRTLRSLQQYPLPRWDQRLSALFQALS